MYLPPLVTSSGSGPASVLGVPGCELVVAAPGFGKTAYLEERAMEPGAVLLPGRELAARLTSAAMTAESIHPGEPPGHLLVDDLDGLSRTARRRLVTSLADLSPGIRLTLASRVPLPRDVIRRLACPVVERAPGDLCLSAEAVVDVLGAAASVDAAAALAVHEATAGWPQLVRLIAAGLPRVGSAGRPPEVLATARDSAAVTWLRSEVLPALAAEARAALAIVASVGPVNDDLVGTLAAAAGHDVEPLLDGAGQLRSLGLLLPAGSQLSRGADLHRLVPLVAVAHRTGVAENAARVRTQRRAAQWYADHELPQEAAQAWHHAGDDEACLQTLVDHGEEILATGGAGRLVALVDSVRVEKPRALRLLLGEALRITGDTAAAQRTLEPLATEPAAVTDPALAWRRAMVCYARADFAAADAVCGKVPPDLPPSVDVSHVLATRAHAQFMLGRQHSSQRLARSSLKVAEAVDDDRALATAHLACALTSAGARRDDHLAAALLAAERSGNRVLSARILINQAGNLLADADYERAAAVGARAVAAARTASPPASLATALHNAGEALTRLGRFDEATASFAEAVRLCRSHGLARTPAALWGLAQVDWLRGRHHAAREAYAEVVEMATESGEVQVLIPALLGWLRCLAACAGSPDERPVDVAAERVRSDVAQAAAAAEVAERCTLEVFRPMLRTIAGRLALCRGDTEGAGRLGLDALTLARQQRNQSAVADALELCAEAADDPTAERAHLESLLAVWQQGGATVCADSVLVRLGNLPVADPAQRADAKSAARRLAEAGVRTGGPGSRAAEPGHGVVIRVLGPFEVTVSGREVPLAAWRSRQARSLVKILASARGRPLTRDWLCEQLWPDDLSDRTGHRLSVLLSAVRSVLDPERLKPTDHYVRADLDAVRLDLRHLRLDVDDMMRDVREADALVRDGQLQRARELLAEVEAFYRGDAFEDEPYESWAEGLREESRAHWARALRLSARLAVQEGDTDLAIGCLLRLLASDPYDEEAHRRLVDVLDAAGRHGEARRRLSVWARAMHELGAPPPDHELLRRRMRNRRTPGSPGAPRTRPDDPVLTRH